ncbi:MAG: hypothetical protein AAGU14_00195 [Eubacteriaceae bacterium]
MSIVKLRRQRKNQDGTYDTIHEETSADIVVGLMDYMYPVGSIYISVINTNPALLFGGTWVAFANGKTLVGIDTTDTDFDTCEETGGAKTHTLTVDQLPSHNHTASSASAGSHNHDIDYDADGAGGGIYATVHKAGYVGGDCNTSTAGAHTHVITINNTGSGTAHNNLQPYIVVYMWKRTA